LEQHEDGKRHRLGALEPPLEKGQQKFAPTPVPQMFSDEALWIRISSANWLAVEDVAIHKFTSHVNNALVNQGLNPAKHYNDDKAAWEIVDIISRYLRKLLKERLAKTPCFGIMVDETIDTSTTQQLILYIKYLEKDEETGAFHVTVEYLDLVSPTSCTAEGITVVFKF
jgi:hypothetical protein